MAIVLASASPRRAELMKLVTPEFEILPLSVREDNIKGSTPARLAQKLSEVKCRAGALRRPYDVVIGCDTVVDYEGRVFGKPADEEDARRMLRTLSGRTHLVHTGVCIFYDSNETEFVTTTRVSFLNLSEADIEAYIATGEPMDKAGAYGIQGQAARFVEGINGCYYNVMGLPVSRLYQTLLSLGYIRLNAPQPQQQISLFDIPITPKAAPQAAEEAQAAEAEAPATQEATPATESTGKVTADEDTMAEKATAPEEAAPAEEAEAEETPQATEAAEETATGEVPQAEETTEAEEAAPETEKEAPAAQAAATTEE